MASRAKSKSYLVSYLRQLEREMSQAVNVNSRDGCEMRKLMFDYATSSLKSVRCCLIIDNDFGSAGVRFIQH